MTKKDYRAIAAALHGLCSVPPYVVDALCDVFRKDNPRFDASRFRSAVRDGLGVRQEDDARPRS